MNVTTLPHVNVPPAQTWNYLRTNEISLKAPVAPETPATDGPAEVLLGIEMGSGDEATAWADASACVRRTVTVPAGGDDRIDVVVSDDEPTPATDVVVGEGGHVTVTITYAQTLGEKTPLAASPLRIRAERDASVDLVTVVAAAGDACLLDDTGISLAEGARLDARQYVVTAGTCALGLAVDMVGHDSRATVVTRYLVRDAQTLDMNYVSRMRGRNTRFDLDISGVLEQGAHKSLRDTIDLVHGAKGAKGRENETVVLAGDDVVNKSLPVILCDEDDVQGDHGATIGSISPEQLRYLADRGLTEADAMALFSRAVVDDAYAHASGAARDAVLSAAEVIYGADAASALADEHADKN